MSKRWKKNRRHRRPRLLGQGPMATIASAQPTEESTLASMPSLLFTYKGADGHTGLLLLLKNKSNQQPVKPVRLLNLMRRNRAIYAPGTPAAVRQRLLEQVLRQDLVNPNTYSPFLVSATYRDGRQPFIVLQFTDFGYKTMKEWLAVHNDRLLDVHVHDLHKHDDRFKDELPADLVYALKVSGYLP